MYLLLIILPLIGSCSAGLFGKKLGPQGSSIVTTGCLSLSFLLSFFAFYEVALIGCYTYIKLTNWIDSEVLNVDWGFMFDSLTVSMCCVVTFVSSLVHLYSIEYMFHNPHLPRIHVLFIIIHIFYAYFSYSRQFCSNVCWEGVGLFHPNSFLFLSCDAPEDWNIGLTKFENLELSMLVILISGITIFLVRQFFIAKKGRPLLTFLVDEYMEFTTKIFNNIIPRRFLFTTLGFGSVIVQNLFIFKYISLKAGIILAFVVPSMSFFFFLGLLLLPLYLAGVYSNSFGKCFV
jgi:hypothetical protein